MTPVRRSIPLLIFIGAAMAGCGSNDRPKPATSAASGPTYAGATVCANCHEEQADLWRGSHHELAMQPAGDESVLGRFDNTRFSHNGITSTFSKRDEEYLVETDGQGGQLETFPVRFTFGVDPLQQYLLELPDGRIQTLGVSWDARPKDDGGQRWMHVYGDEIIDHNDVLHWTRIGQNWDSMCAFCHSTGLKKQFDPQSGLFESSWAEINVACEACHGPGSRHVELAESGQEDGAGFAVRFDERDGTYWTLNADNGNSRRSRPRQSSVEINTCAACHSRRSQISDRPQPGNELLDDFRPALIRPPLYFADGQMLDEVYVYGSFLQSKMYRHGVTCSDCHDPHSLDLRAPGPQVCLQCHSEKTFSNTEHHMHSAQSAGANCIECHMPATTYMQVDARHDHSFRIPRPDLSAEFNTPNACTTCHTDQSAAWAADELRSRGKRSGDNHWQEKLATILTGRSGARELLGEMSADQNVPAIVRASIIVQAQYSGDVVLLGTIASQAGHDDPLIRWAVARALQGAPAPIVARYASPMLEDVVRAVRIDAANALASVPLELLPVRFQPLLQTVLDESVEVELVNNERSEAHVNIGNLERRRRRPENSERAYRLALELNPLFVPAYVNLADLYRELGREAAGDRVLREGIELLPGQPSLRYALGLSLVRQGRGAESRTELSLAAESRDAEPRMALAYALILDAQGETAAAIDYLVGSRKRFGDDPALLSALINLYQRTDQRKAADRLVRRLRDR